MYFFIKIIISKQHVIVTRQKRHKGKENIPMLWIIKFHIKAGSLRLCQLLHVEIVLKTKQPEAETSLVYDVFIQVIKKRARAERVTREKETE